MTINKTATHTPGDWKLGDERVIGDDIYYEIEVEGYGVVALVVATPESPELIANAHLAAAAPELLDALRNLLGTSGHYLAPDEVLATDFDCPTSWIKQARAAIKKGETQ